jgi:predicted negative regulator of RcsB-dependent stress response
VESYRTEEEQVEALRRWWDENGRSMIVAIVVALSAGFGWQGWQSYQQQSIAGASNIYQSLLQNIEGGVAAGEQNTRIEGLAGQLKNEFPGSSYAQFAALHLASMAVSENKLAEAEAQLRWVLAKADKGGDIAQVTELRLARVLAASGREEQALEILQRAGTGSYGASFAMARGDVLLQLDRKDEARDAYTDARSLAQQGAGQPGLATLDQKLQSLSPLPARALAAEEN